MRIPAVEQLGLKSLQFVSHLGRMAAFVGHTARVLALPRYRVRRFVNELFDVGVLSLPVILLSGIVVGAVLAFLGFYALSRFGAEGFLGAVVGWALVRELGPVLTALLVTGRAGSAMAAEIASMVTTEQIDGLRMMSIDPVDRHDEWSRDIEDIAGTAPNYPIIADTDYTVAKAYGMLAGDVDGDVLTRTAADNQTVRNVFVIGPDKKIKLMLTYPMTTGRNFDEILRVLDSMQLTAKHKVATPVNWKHGDDVIIAGSVNDEDAKKLFPEGWQAPKPYLRVVKQPR